MTSPETKTAVYSTVDGVDIALDYVVPTKASPENKAPILLWFHGGGLLQGTRKGTWPHLRNAPEKHGLCLVSADYRLAPQTRLPGIMADLVAVMSFIRSSEFSKLTGDSVDQEKIIVSGGSAGGWLALLIGSGVGFEACGLEAPEKPLGIAPIYPISDLLDPFWTTKQHPVSYFPRVIDRSELEAYLDPKAPPTSYSTLDSTRSIFYHYMVQEGILQDLLLDETGIEPNEFSIAPAIASGKATVPPTYIIHGTIDDKVPIQQSIDVVEACKAKGLPVVFDAIEGADHLFDMKEDVTMDNMYKFIDSLLSK
ncbi:hypothetical protein CI109_106718 [Kwoniella shandongensis]|uniref:BD-FAE-like domain-containing protein n=1 Tax=Kwoniella shandongensis TaxID=1734106 RepID=A0A5M6C6U7_9TREE|nr:uncharacterized protein CI109_001026 [Kwoniella shandongensis]KAA5530846.1 hypothetical protein CI109_001026 [Kwoniella shandongensis]